MADRNPDDSKEQTSSRGTISQLSIENACHNSTSFIAC